MLNFIKSNLLSTLISVFMLVFLFHYADVINQAAKHPKIVVYVGSDILYIDLNTNTITSETGKYFYHGEDIYNKIEDISAEIEVKDIERESIALKKSIAHRLRYGSDIRMSANGKPTLYYVDVLNEDTFKLDYNEANEDKTHFWWSE